MLARHILIVYKDVFARRTVSFAGLCAAEEMLRSGPEPHALSGEEGLVLQEPHGEQPGRWLLAGRYNEVGSKG